MSVPTKLLEVKMEIMTLQEALGSLGQIIDRSCKENKMFKITTPDSAAVVLSEETYENLLVTLEFLSTPGLLERLQEKRDVS